MLGVLKIGLAVGLGLASLGLVSSQCTTVRIQSGDTFTVLADRYNTNATAIQQSNPTVNATNLQINQPIQICNGNISSTGPSPAAGSSCAGKEYAIKSGDTAGDLATQCGVTLDGLLALNKQITNPNSIVIGDKLCLPSTCNIQGASPAPAPSSSGCSAYKGTYVVKSGDTLQNIAATCNVNPYTALQTANGIRNGDRLDVGNRICIPADCSLATSTTSSPSPSVPATSKGGGLSGGAIAGIVIGCIAGLALLLGIVLLFVRRRRHIKERWGDKGPMSNRIDEESNKNSGNSSLERYTDEDSVVPGDRGAAIPYSDFLHNQSGNDAGVGLDMRNLHLSSTNASTFENLPKHWRIPLERVKLVCVDGQAIVLGRGGFGDVYQAIVRQEQAALKTVRGGDPKEQARLLHEIKVLEQCRSVHIVQFLGYSVAGNRLLLAMELLRGGSLYNALRQNDEFQWYNRGRQAMVAVTAGLSVLHEQGVAHLDMKTANLLITADRQVKIADFGLGKLVNGPTTTATQQGTFVWMAPEQILRGVCSRASDIWALSTIFWEVCTLEKPTRAIVPEEMEVGKDCPKELIDLIAACRKDDPHERPTIDQVCEWLDRIP